MQDNIKTKHRSLSIAADVDYTDVVNKAAILFYKEGEMGRALEVIGREVELTGGAQIVRGEDCFWVVRACGEEESRECIEEVERLVGLTFTVVCIEVSNRLEAVVEKAFSSALAHAQSSLHQIKLILLRSTYTNKLHTIEIKYCRDTPDLLPLLYDTNYLKTSPITVLDLIQIFDCDLPENVAKVRQVYQKYEAIRLREEEIERVSRTIFEDSRQKSQLMRELAPLRLSSQRENKLIWKLERLNRYKEWRQEERESSSAEASHLTFADLHSKITLAAINKYHAAWTANSLLALKHLFNKISNKNDSASIQNFTALYQAMRRNLEAVEADLVNLPYAHAITLMREELEDFYGYHQTVIQEEGLGLAKYLKEEAKFKWKYNNKIYKKIAAFSILLALACAQENLIKSLSVLSIALIVLAIRC